MTMAGRQGLDLRTREGGLLQTRGRATGRRSGRRLLPATRTMENHMVLIGQYNINQLSVYQSSFSNHHVTNHHFPTRTYGHLGIVTLY